MTKKEMELMKLVIWTAEKSEKNWLRQHVHELLWKILEEEPENDQ